MIATNYSEVRNNLKTYCDKATKDYETIIITRKNKVYREEARKLKCLKRLENLKRKRDLENLYQIEHLHY